MRLFRILPYLPKIGSELLLAAGINAAFLLVAALILWPVGRAALGGSLALGLLAFVIAGALMLITSVILHTVFRITTDPPSDACVIVNLLASVVLQAGWAAFVALAVNGCTAGASLIATCLLHLVGLVASWFGTVATGAYFQGSVYKSACALVAFLGYAIFAFWPGIARLLYGWLFAWF